MRLFDEVDFDYAEYGFKEEKLGDVNLSILDVEQDNECFDKGSYRIVSCHNLFLSEKLQIFVTNKIKKFLKELLSILQIKDNSCVLLCGLGNNQIMADSFGENVCKKVLATRLINSNLITYKVCSICPNVQSVTGIKTFDIVNGVAKSVKADLIILIDSLMTSNIKRLGHSFQLSTVGITPGGAIRDNKAINLKTTGVPCLTIGVPFMLDLKSVSNKINKSIILTPKDIKILIDKCSNVLADAINGVLNNNFKNCEIKELLTTF